MSQADLALRLKHRGVKLTRHLIDKWERGEQEPELDADDMHHLAEALRWSIRELRSAME